MACTTVTTAGAGGESTALYVTEGDDVTLPCKNVLHPNCYSSTWLYAGRSSKSAVELVGHGKIKDPQNHRRLSLLTDCSLHINNVSADDAGQYTCQTFINGQKHGHDTAAFLSVLTEQSRGKTTGNKHRPTEKTSTATETSQKTPTHTGSHTNLINTGTVCTTADSPEDNNGHTETTLKTPTHTGSHTNHTNHTTVVAPTNAGLLPGIGAAAAVFGAVCLAVVVMVTYRRRADGSSPPRMSENHMTSNPKTTEDEVTYSMVNHPAPKKRERANSDNFTEYATVRTGA
ncbi:uncharacterized protein [Paramormyrops kingsleyae]|uniref:uncharacterized protein n=1 Tax=Paramormyrops kingsleyae TaxID=1676925 RepID=UPI003B9759FA